MIVELRVKTCINRFKRRVDSFFYITSYKFSTVKKKSNLRSTRKIGEYKNVILNLVWASLIKWIYSGINNNK